MINNFLTLQKQANRGDPSAQKQRKRNKYIVDPDNKMAVFMRSQRTS